ncbi:MAG: tetratricopeptide repeat protein, partial [Thiomonas sp.]|nr:tetratricopeptide repeat protein [Thiomonas sp.]
PQDYAQAASWFRKAADQGDARAQCNLGLRYYNGQGVPQDYAQAASWYRKAADQGYARAQYNLGVLYDNGQGVPQDYAQAASWYRKAADQGDARAQCNLGVLYDNGQGVPQDYAQAASWFRKAADQGDADAQHNLQLLMTTGKTPALMPPPVPGMNQPESVDSLYEQIIKAGASIGLHVWRPIAIKLQSADMMAKVRSQAELGNAHAEDVLANCYSHGWGGLPQDDAQAAHWYRKAADQGDDDAQNNLGSLYELGMGVPQNRQVAYALYDIAATKGNPAARRNRNQLEQKLSTKDLESAEKLEQQMRADKYPTAAIIGFLTKKELDRPENSAEQMHAASSLRKKNNTVSQNSPWPMRPAKQPGETTCNTRCINGSCWRTYDDGRHVHLNIAPSIDPFSGNMTFDPPPC